ncbi:MAG: hypothetical protein ACOC1O_00935 [bacterium]
MTIKKLLLTEKIHYKESKAIAEELFTFIKKKVSEMDLNSKDVEVIGFEEKEFKINQIFDKHFDRSGIDIFLVLMVYPDDIPKNFQASTTKKEIEISLTFNPSELKKESVLLNGIQHEVIHALDYLKSAKKNKGIIRTLKRAENYEDLIPYLTDTYELNQLFTKTIGKNKEEFKKAKSVREVLKILFLSVREELRNEVVNKLIKNSKFVRKVIDRLNREGIKLEL